MKRVYLISSVRIHWETVGNYETGSVRIHQETVGNYDTGVPDL